MSRLRTGPIYSQDVLNQLKRAAQLQPSNDHDEDEAVFKEKTRALQRFLNHGMARFSIESLKHILDNLMDFSKMDINMPSQVRSVSELRDVVKSTVTKRDAGSLKSSDATALIYMEHFFFAIYCMTEVKKMFDEIYGDMYFSYYTEKDVSRQVTRVQSSHSRGEHGQGEDYSQFGILTLEQMTGSTQHKLRLTVNDVNGVLTRWTNMLTDEEPKLEHFDPESEQDLMLVQRSSRMEPILRLLPDIFAKYYKILELLKQWWVLAHEIFPNLPFQRCPPSTHQILINDKREIIVSSPDDNIFDAQSLSEEAAVHSEISEAMKAVKESSSVLIGLEEELESLEKREEKFEILGETYDKVGDDIDIKTKERQELWVSRELLKHGNKGPELQEVQNKLRKLESELRPLEFQHALLSQDYMLHMEIRPSIIRFHGDVARHVHDARATFDQELETLEKLITEKNEVAKDKSRSEETLQTIKNSVSDRKVLLKSRDTDIVAMDNSHNASTADKTLLKIGGPSNRNVINKRMGVPVENPKMERKQPVEKVKNPLEIVNSRDVKTRKCSVGKPTGQPKNAAKSDKIYKEDTQTKTPKSRPVPLHTKVPRSLPVKYDNMQPSDAKKAGSSSKESKILPLNGTTSVTKPREQSISTCPSKPTASPFPITENSKAVMSSAPSSTRSKTSREDRTKQLVK